MTDNLRPGGGRVVSERVVGSSNPVARYFRKLMSSIGGVVLGVILFIGSFGIMWFSENFTKHSEVVVALPMSEAAQVAEISGPVKFEGPVEVQETVSAPPLYETEALYYHYLEEFCEIEVYTETETITRDGQDIEQTIEKERNVWAGEPMEEWGQFMVGGVNVNPSTAQNRLTLTELERSGNFGSGECALGTYRHVTKVYNPGEATTFLVVGDASGGSVNGGDTFILTDMSEAGLMSELESEENTTFWVLKAAAAVAFAFGLTMILGPIFALLNVLPGLGKMLGAIVFFVSLVLGVIVVALSTIVLKFWWLILILLIGLGVWAFMKKKNQDASGGAPKK